MGILVVPGLSRVTMAGEVGTAPRYTTGDRVNTRSCLDLFWANPAGGRVCFPSFGDVDHLKNMALTPLQVGTLSSYRDTALVTIHDALGLVTGWGKSERKPPQRLPETPEWILESFEGPDARGGGFLSASRSHPGRNPERGSPRLLHAEAEEEELSGHLRDLFASGKLALRSERGPFLQMELVSELLERGRNKNLLVIGWKGARAMALQRTSLDLLRETVQTDSYLFRFVAASPSEGVASLLGFSEGTPLAVAASLLSTEICAVQYEGAQTTLVQVETGTEDDGREHLSVSIDQRSRPLGTGGDHPWPLAPVLIERLWNKARALASSSTAPQSPPSEGGAPSPSPARSRGNLRLV